MTGKNRATSIIIATASENRHGFLVAVGVMALVVACSCLSAGMVSYVVSVRVNQLVLVDSGAKAANVLT
jgi:hypothetical protein